MQINVLKNNQKFLIEDSAYTNILNHKVQKL